VSVFYPCPRLILPPLLWLELEWLLDPAERLLDPLERLLDPVERLLFDRELEPESVRGRLGRAGSARFRELLLSREVVLPELSRG
jgi:hypothetical protein